MGCSPEYRFEHRIFKLFKRFLLPPTMHSFSFLCLDSLSITVLSPIPTLPEVALIESLSLGERVSFTAHSLFYCTLFPKLVPFPFVEHHVSVLFWGLIDFLPFPFFKNFFFTIIYVLELKSEYVNCLVELDLSNYGDPLAYLLLLLALIGCTYE